MRGSISALIIFTVASIFLGAVVAVAALNGKNVEPYASSSSAVTTAIAERTDATATAPVVLEMDTLLTISTFKPDTTVINIRTDGLPTNAAVDGSLTIQCGHEWCQDSNPMCTYGPGFAARDPVKAHISNDPITSRSKSTRPILLGDREDIKTLTKKQNVAPVLMVASDPASIDCMYKYCDDRTQYCMYWAGVTGWNPSLGPVPGMTRTTLGACQVPATDPATYIWVKSTMATIKERVCSTRTSSFRTLAV